MNQASCFGDTGYMQLLSSNADNHLISPAGEPVALSDGSISISPPLLESFLESYVHCCHTWCPVLDQDLLLAHLDHSPLLQNAIALCGNRVNPPLIRVRDSAEHYSIARSHFYGGTENNALVRLASVMLFWWWSTGCATMPNMDNAWWWTGIAIRIAEEMGLHREPPSTLPPPIAGLRRRIWWTLFMRDSILSLSQGRPTSIDQYFCTVRMVSPADFPNPDSPGVTIFIASVRLAQISARIIKQRSDTPQALISWIQSLPASISVNIRSPRTQSFNRDTHRLHLSYLTVVVLLNLSRSPGPLPHASDVAIIAASCIARLWEDYLARGNIRFLSGEAGWEIAVALLALLDAQRADSLRAAAQADIDTLCTALREMARLWPSSRMFEVAFDKIFECYSSKRVYVADETLSAPIPTAHDAPPDPGDKPNRVAESYNTYTHPEPQYGHEHADPTDPDTTWMEYFPFITGATSPLIDAVLTRNLSRLATSQEPLWPLDINDALQAFLVLPGMDWEGGGLDEGAVNGF